MPVVAGTSIVNGRRLLTAADLAALPTYLPTGDVRYELVRGILHVLPLGTCAQSVVRMELLTALKEQADSRGLGRTLLGTGIVFTKNPDTVIGPSLSYIKAESLPYRVSPQDWLETMPDLIVEVPGIFDEPDEVVARTDLYLNAGTKLVWVADPQRKVVEQYRRNEPVRTLLASDTLSAEAIIPGFRLPLAELFAE
jgi:Uma2 family endonuclease